MWDRALAEHPGLGVGGDNRATYTGLPPSYLDFVYKHVYLAYDGVGFEYQTLAVFFPADATNHGLACATATNADTFRGDSGHCRNFYAYGIQVLPAAYPPDVANPVRLVPLFDDTLPTSSPLVRGETPAVYNWVRYAGRRDIALFGSASYGCKEGAAILCGYSDPPELCGLAAIATTWEHERFHINQVDMYNSASVPFWDPRGTRVTAVTTSCPAPPCGWAFFDDDRDEDGDGTRGNVPATSRWYNRFQNNDGIDGYTSTYPPDHTGPRDVGLDTDDDTIPDWYDWVAGYDNFEDEAKLAEHCNPGAFALVDWACPGRNANRAGPVGAPTGTCF